MIGNSKRGIRLMSWRTLRWAIALPTLPLVWWACTSHPLTQPTPSPEQQTDIYISVSTQRLLDLVFMIDNSPSMGPTHKNKHDQFPGLINALKDPNDGTLPDLRVAIIDSDLGTGPNAYTGGSCGPKTLPDGTNSNYGDQGRFQMIGASGCGVTSPDATYLDYSSTKGPLNFTGDISTVFQCLAKGLGTAGCGEEHQLQAYEWAIVASGLGDVNDAQHKMIRGNAYLGLVFLSDEDDCSAYPNDGMFGDIPSLRGESASIRCYTRAYTCNGTNTSKSPPGYPTDAPFATALANCQARSGDSCTHGEDVSQTTSCNPLKDVVDLANEVKTLKSSDPSQLLVAGIFGWPLEGTDPAQAQYKVDLIPNPSTNDPAHPTVWDTWPVCYDPNHQPSAATTDKTTNFDSTAAGYGATPGLRMSKFIDQFGDNGLKFSICETDFAKSMKTIGDTIAKHLQNLCVNYKLWTNPATGSPDCRVAYRVPVIDANNKVTYTEDPIGMPECAANATPDNIQADCWQLTLDTTKCKDAYNGQLINVVRTRAELNDPSKALVAGTKVGMQCRTCTDFVDQNGNPLSGC